MIIRNNNLSFQRLKKSDIELVRTKRNSAAVRKFMHYTKEISVDMQLKWFESIDTIYNYYFLIKLDNYPIGLINSKDIDYSLSTYEAGIFIWDENYWQTEVPVACSLIMTDFHFYFLDFCENTLKTLSSNHKVQSYNSFFGYKPYAQELPEIRRFKLERMDYDAMSVRLKKSLKKYPLFNGVFDEKSISFEDDTLEDIRKLYLSTALPLNVYNKFKSLIETK